MGIPTWLGEPAWSSDLSQAVQSLYLQKRLKEIVRILSWLGEPAWNPDKRDWSGHSHLLLARRLCGVNISDFTLHRFVAHSAKFKMKYVNIKYRSWSCRDSQKVTKQCYQSFPNHYPFALCNYFCQYETPLFRIHVFRMRRLSHTPNLSWLQNLNFKFGALRHGKRRGLAFYTGTSCLNVELSNKDKLKAEKLKKLQ